jgi:hypothetical protein
MPGMFPLSWSNLTGKTTDLSLDGNVALRGCVPLDSQTTLSYSDTSMSGL